jgi:transketolase
MSSSATLSLDGRDRLLTEGVHARVVSMPSTNLFAAQSDDYREKILPTNVPLLVIEAGSPVGRQSFVGPRIAVIGIDTFGSSAPGSVVMEHYGFTMENVCRQAHHVLDQLKVKASCA